MTGETKKMKNFKTLFAALTLTMVLAFGTNMASAGLLISDFTGGSGDPCQPTETVDSVTGIIVLGFTGLLISDFAETSTPPAVDCGIIVLG